MAFFLLSSFVSFSAHLGLSTSTPTSHVQGSQRRSPQGRANTCVELTFKTDKSGLMHPFCFMTVLKNIGSFLTSPDICVLLWKMGKIMCVCVLAHACMVYMCLAHKSQPVHRSLVDLNCQAVV